MERIGARVRAYRTRAPYLSVPGLAKAIGATPRYVEMIEAGKRIPSIPTLYKLAEALGVGAADLLADDVDAAPDSSPDPTLVRAG